MKKLTLSLVTALVVSSGLYADESSTSDVELSANVALTSNYVWRGMTQNTNAPAIQGGFDLGYKGLYAGVWGSNVDFGDDATVELDFYAGYAGEIDAFSYDLGYCQYTYPGVSKASNFGEATLGLGYDLKVVSLNAKYYLGVKTDDLDPENGFEVGLSVPLPMDVTLDASYGDYDKTGGYYFVSATKSFEKFDISLAYTGMNYDNSATANEDNLIATISASF